MGAQPTLAQKRRDVESDRARTQRHKDPLDVSLFPGNYGSLQQLVCGMEAAHVPSRWCWLQAPRHPLACPTALAATAQLHMQEIVLQQLTLCLPATLEMKTVEGSSSVYRGLPLATHRPIMARRAASQQNAHARGR